MGKIQELKDRIRKFNADARTEEVQTLALELFPGTEVMQMGYGGSYQDCLIGNRLINYAGQIITDENKLALVNDYFEQDLGYAFGTTSIETQKGDLHQIYTCDGIVWNDDMLNANAVSDRIEIGGIDDALDYIKELKATDTALPKKNKAKK
jgi:hypothetical protein